VDRRRNAAPALVVKTEPRRFRLPDGAEIPYLLKRSPRRRTIGLRIDPAGLTVHAPLRTPLYRLEGVLVEKAGWVSDKLAEMQARRPPARAWRDGEILPYLGQTLRLAVCSGAVRAVPLLTEGCLQVALPDVTDAAAVHAKVVKWYRRQALDILCERAALLAAQLGVAQPPLALSNAASRWGSCNSRGEVRLNWRLVKAPLHLIDYVVAHELAHLKHLDHSAAFWHTVATIYPDCLAARRELKAGGHLFHTF